LLNDTKGMSDPTIESQLDGVQSQTDILYDHDSVDTGLMSGILAVGTAQSILLAVIGQI
jgi:hypothetical protein